MAQPKLKTRRVNTRLVADPAAPPGPSYQLTDAQRANTAKQRRRACQARSATAGIKRTGGFGIA